MSIRSDSPTGQLTDDTNPLKIQDSPYLAIVMPLQSANGEVMTFDHEDQQKKLREFYEATGDKAVLWIDNETGQIVDSLPIESRIGPGIGLEFEIADCELQPVPPRHQIGAPALRQKHVQHRPVDLVGARDRVSLKSEAPKLSARGLPEVPRRLLLGRRGGP